MALCKNIFAKKERELNSVCACKVFDYPGYTARTTHALLREYSFLCITNKSVEVLQVQKNNIQYVISKSCLFRIKSILVFIYQLQM